MKKFLFGFAVFFISFMATSDLSNINVVKAHEVNDVGYNKNRVMLKDEMKRLWEDHITYTRNYIISSIANLEDKDAVAARLLKNQDDIGNLIKPYYGEEAGKKLSSLLRDHIIIATKVVDAAKAGNNDELTKYSKEWTINADAIADFLSKANPNWDNKILKEMLYKHLQYTTNEVTARLKKDWKADIDAYDKGHVHMLGFAKELSKGIMKQFPEKFK